jgi:hypothetical protein
LTGVLSSECGIADALALKITATEPRKLRTELANAKPSGAGVLFLADDGLGTNGELAGEFAGNAGEVRIIEVLDEPFAEPALTPLSHIDGVDRARKVVESWSGGVMKRWG